MTHAMLLGIWQLSQHYSTKSIWRHNTQYYTWYNMSQSIQFYTQYMTVVTTKCMLHTNIWQVSTLFYTQWHSCHILYYTVVTTLLHIACDMQNMLCSKWQSCQAILCYTYGLIVTTHYAKHRYMRCHSTQLQRLCRFHNTFAIHRLLHVAKYSILHRDSMWRQNRYASRLSMTYHLLLAVAAMMNNVWYPITKNLLLLPLFFCSLSTSHLISCWAKNCQL